MALSKTLFLVETSLFPVVYIMKHGVKNDQCYHNGIIKVKHTLKSVEKYECVF